MNKIDQDSVLGVSVLDANNLLFEFFSDNNFESRFNEIFIQFDVMPQAIEAMFVLRNTFRDFETEEQKRNFISMMVKLIQFGSQVDRDEIDYFSDNNFLNGLATDSLEAIKGINPSTISYTFLGSILACNAMDVDNELRFGVLAALCALISSYAMNLIGNRLNRRISKPTADDVEFFRNMLEQIKEYDAEIVPVQLLSILLKHLIDERDLSNS